MQFVDPDDLQINSDSSMIIQKIFALELSRARGKITKNLCGKTISDCVMIEAGELWVTYIISWKSVNRVVISLDVIQISLMR